MNINALEFLSVVNEQRQTVKTYRDEAIDPSSWAAIVKAVSSAPSALDFKPYRIVIVDATSLLVKEIMGAAYAQPVIAEARKIMLFVVPSRIMYMSKNYVNERLKRLHPDAHEVALKNRALLITDYLAKEEENSDAWAMKQCYEALGYALIAATLVGVGSTAMEGFERAKLTTLLRANKIILERERVAVMCLFGYPKGGDTAYLHRGSGQRVRDDFDVKFKTV